MSRRQQRLDAADVPPDKTAAAHRRDHGRQRPLGQNGRGCRGSKGIAAAWPACAARSRNAARLGIEQLTLYCLSSENWKRPQHELDFLMHLLEQYMIEERTHDHGAEHPRAHHRPPRRHPRNACRRDGQDDRDERAQHGHCGSAWRSTTAAGPNWSTPFGGSPARCATASSRRTRSTKQTLRRPPLHGRHARSRSADSHGRRDADQQLPALADQLRRIVGDRIAAGPSSATGSARGHPRLRRPRPSLRRT